MYDEMAVAVIFRQRAMILRRKLTLATTGSARRRLTHLAEEYEWRAARLESSIAIRESTLAKTSEQSSDGVTDQAPGE